MKKIKIFYGILVFILLIGMINSENMRVSDNVNVEWNNVKNQTSDAGHRFTFESGGALSVSYGGNKAVYSDLEAASGKQPEILVDKGGKVIEAYFKTGKEGKYILGNEEVFLPKGAEVNFKDGYAEIKVPTGTKVTPPRAFDNKPGETTFSFKSPDGKLMFENGNSFSGEALKFKEGKFFFDCDAILDETLVKNQNKIKTYIDFEGKVNGGYDSSYISLDRKNGKIVLGSNVNQIGPTVAFTKNNPFGIRLLDNDHFSMMCLGNVRGSYISVENRNAKGLIPRIETLNQFVINEDGKSVYYNSETQKLYLRPETVIKDFGAGSSTTPVEIVNLHNPTGQMLTVSRYGNILGFGDDGEIAYGPNPYYISSSTSHGYKSSPWLMKGFSNWWFYYNIKTEQDLERFFGNKINFNDRAGLLRDSKNVRAVLDTFAGVPQEQWMHIKNVNFISSAGYSGLAWPGNMNLVVRGGFSPAVARHEMAHVHDFTFSSRSEFNRLWNSIGGANGPHTYNYGYTDAEDTSTFAEMIYKDSWGQTSSRNFGSWKNGLSDSYQYNKKIRGKVAIFAKFGFISRQETARIFGSAGLASDDDSLNRYIKEAQDARTTR